MEYQSSIFVNGQSFDNLRLKDSDGTVRSISKVYLGQYKLWPTNTQVRVSFYDSHETYLTSILVPIGTVLLGNADFIAKTTRYPAGDGKSWQPRNDRFSIRDAVVLDMDVVPKEIGSISHFEHIVKQKRFLIISAADFAKIPSTGFQTGLYYFVYD